MKNTIIAIDGYSSCGKSTLAKAISKRLNFVYIDSGAMYRAVTLYFIRNNVNYFDEAEVDTAIENISIELITTGEEPLVLLNGEDVSDEIRKIYISSEVSKISPLSKVRKALVKQQQLMGETQNLIMDGRDIGSVVFPNADIKIFMTADPMVRAKRRFDELSLKNENLTLLDVHESLKERDQNDLTRSESPLICPTDAVILDNSNLSKAEQLEFVLSLYRNKYSPVENGSSV